MAKRKMGEDTRGKYANEIAREIINFGLRKGKYKLTKSIEGGVAARKKFLNFLYGTLGKIEQYYGKAIADEMLAQSIGVAIHSTESVAHDEGMEMGREWGPHRSRRRR